MRISHRILMTHEIFVATEMVIEVGKSRDEASAEDLSRLVWHTFVGERRETAPRLSGRAFFRSMNRRGKLGDEVLAIRQDPRNEVRGRDSQKRWTSSPKMGVV